MDNDYFPRGTFEGFASEPHFPGEDLGRKHNYHFSASIAIFFAIFLSGGRVDEYRLHTVAANFGLRSLFHNLAFFGHGGLFLRRGAFYGGEKADERVVASYLAAKPPLSLLCRHP